MLALVSLANVSQRETGIHYTLANYSISMPFATQLLAGCLPPLHQTVGYLTFCVLPTFWATHHIGSDTCYCFPMGHLAYYIWPLAISLVTLPPNPIMPVPPVYLVGSAVSTYAMCL